MDLKMYIPCSRLHGVYCIGEHSVLNQLCKWSGKRLCYAHACCSCISYVILIGWCRTPTFCLFLRYILNTNHRVQQLTVIFPRLGSPFHAYATVRFLQPVCKKRQRQFPYSNLQQLFYSNNATEYNYRYNIQITQHVVEEHHVLLIFILQHVSANSHAHHQVVIHTKYINEFTFQEEVSPLQIVVILFYFNINISINIIPYNETVNSMCLKMNILLKYSYYGNICQVIF